VKLEGVRSSSRQLLRGKVSGEEERNGLENKNTWARVTLRQGKGQKKE
jgi:hypothetical protein